MHRLRESEFPRHLDRALVGSLLRALGAVRRPRSMPRRISRVGIMMFETIGDTLLASTIIASLRVSPGAPEVVVFASRGNMGALSLIDGISQVVDVPLLRPLAAIAAIRSVEVDVMIDIGQWPHWYAMLCALSRSSCTIGFAGDGQSRHHAFDFAIPHRRDVHEVENFRALLAPFGAMEPIDPARALKPLGNGPSALAPTLPYVVFHPWAGGFNAAAREWPLDRWCALAARARSHGCEVLVSGAPADAAQADELVRSCGGDSGIRSIAGRCSLAELALLLKRASAVVCVNTGIMHLAAMLNVPLVALHGPTSRLRWGPVGSRSVALAPPAGVQGEFLHFGFEYPRDAVDSMSAITLDDVWVALRPMLEQASDRH